MDSSLKNVGIFGGTFDPIHYGHLFLAESAYEKFGLDKVLFMATPSPYHRNDKKTESLPDRINMVKLAIADNPHFEFSDFEINLPGPTYTVNTLTELKKAYPDCHFYFIMGGDSLFSVELWYKFQEIFRMATILVSKREGENAGASGLFKQPDDQKASSQGDMSDNSCNSLSDELNLQIEYLKEKYGADIRNIDSPNIEISSHEIINRIREGKSVKYYLKDEVIDYIQSHGIYVLR